jgi:hypothetical protein
MIFMLAENVDLTGGVAAAFVQTAGDTSWAVPSTLSISLPAGGSSVNNRTVMGAWITGNWSHSPNTAGLSEMDELLGTGSLAKLWSGYTPDAFIQTVVVNTGNPGAPTGAGFLISAELKALSSATTRKLRVVTSPLRW